MDEEEIRIKSKELADKILRFVWDQRNEYPPKICINSLMLATFSVVAAIDFDQSELQLCFKVMQTTFDQYKEAVIMQINERNEKND